MGKVDYLLETGFKVVCTKQFIDL